LAAASVEAPLPAAAAVSDSAICGCRMPNSIAAVAPIDKPTRWDFAIPRPRSTTAASSAARSCE